MKYFGVILFFMFMCTSAIAQVDWQEFIVYDADLDESRSIKEFEYVEFADLDNDGDNDIIAASVRINSSTSSMLMWFRNEGDLTFSDPIVIFKQTGSIDKPFIDVGDIDNDGDIDIAYVSTEKDPRILWFENINSANQFEEHFITNMFFESCGVLRDMDSDGDLDILTAGTRHTEWYKNTDGKGNFKLQERFYEYFNGSRHMITGEDFDNDGDLDVIYWRANGGTFGADEMHIHYNLDGQGNFGNSDLLLDGSPAEIIDIEFIDMNDDQEKDIVIAHGKSGSRYVGKIVWKEISNGQIQHSGGTLANIIGLTYIDKVDVDNDGDLDIITSTRKESDPFNKGMFLIALNDGNGQFESPIRIEQEKGTLTKVKAVDLNNDGFVEIVGASKNGVYGLDLDFVSSPTNNLQSDNYFVIAPNPVVNELRIIPPNSIGEYNIEIFDINGNSVYIGANKTQIEVGYLTSGTYMLYIKDKSTDKKLVQKFIIP